MDPELSDLEDWLDGAAETGSILYLKYLAANDTVATGSHQVGPLVSIFAFKAVYPTLLTRAVRTTTGVADRVIKAFVDSHGFDRQVRLVWYRSKGEGRITGWG